MSHTKRFFFSLCFMLLVVQCFATEFNWFSQSDSRWQYDRLGRSTSIGRSGCVLSCLSMLLNAEASNPYMTPDKLNSWLRKNGGYYGNDLRWQIPGLIDGEGLGLELEAQSFRYNDWHFLASELEKGHKVIVKVNGRRSHWVLVVKRDGPANRASSYYVNDPGMTDYEARTLAYWGGFRSARSYSGIWLDEQTFKLSSEINVVPIPEDESFLYDIYGLPLPADVFVSLQNVLDVDISGFFILGLFDSTGELMYTIDYKYATIGANEEIDLLFEMQDYTPLEDERYTLQIIYSKYFSAMPSRYDTLHLQSSFHINLSTDIDPR
ncbi:MAG: hypothetical protein PWP64_52 [Candidatus Cloacimonadota bacterium]|nr:hypothetical protein [Candidatus Cloacimonadota bacterium]